jgi:hypothetical protein
VTWSKLSDDYGDDCETLSDAAFRLHTEAIVWSNRKLLDCRIPRSDVRRFARDPEGAALPELVAAGFWQLDGDFVILIHHAAYQRFRSSVVNQQAQNAANGKKGGRAPRAPRELSPGSNSLSNLLSDSPTNVDRTGQDRTGIDDPDSLKRAKPKLVADAKESRADYPGKPSCIVCGSKLFHPASVASGVCGKTDDAHRLIRATA